MENYDEKPNSRAEERREGQSIDAALCVWGNRDFVQGNIVTFYSYAIIDQKSKEQVLISPRPLNGYEFWEHIPEIVYRLCGYSGIEIYNGRSLSDEISYEIPILKEDFEDLVAILTIPDNVLNVRRVTQWEGKR